MGKSAFDKFINKPDSGAKKKEKIRQEKKKAREEKKAWFDEQKRLARERRAAGGQKRNDRTAGRRQTPEEPARTGKRMAVKKREQPGNSRGTAPARKTGFEKRKESTDSRTRRTTTPRNEAPSFKKNDSRGTVPAHKTGFEKRKESTDGRIRRTTTTRNEASVFKKSDSRKQVIKDKKPRAVPAPAAKGAASAKEEGEMPLNKFIAWCGICGRREAVDLIKAGKVTVNGEVITNPPHRVSRTDTIKVNGKKVSVQKNLVYILLNKPKDYITTTDDPEGRKTVMDLVRSATDERVFPVGRLDRNTTGVLLLTNDGEVAQRMTHPKYEVKKIYEVKLDKPVTKQQLDTIASGIQLDDGFIQPDAVAWADAKDRSVIGIEIHSGKNRIVRRIFEKLGFKVKNLDRVMYGIFTKKNVDRGKWRFLSEKEIRLLKHLNTSFAPKKSAR